MTLSSTIGPLPSMQDDLQVIFIQVYLKDTSLAGAPCTIPAQNAPRVKLCGT